MTRKRPKRSVYPVWTAVLDSLAYIADDLRPPYPQRPFGALEDVNLMTAHAWAMKLLAAVEHEVAERPGLPGVPLTIVARRDADDLTAVEPSS